MMLTSNFFCFNPENLTLLSFIFHIFFDVHAVNVSWGEVIGTLKMKHEKWELVAKLIYRICGNKFFWFFFYTSFRTFDGSDRQGDRFEDLELHCFLDLKLWVINSLSGDLSFIDRIIYPCSCRTLLMIV